MGDAQKPRSFDELEALNAKVHEGTGALIDGQKVPVPHATQILKAVKLDAGTLMREKVAEAGPKAKGRIGKILTDLLLEAEKGDSRPVVKAVEMARGLGVNGEALVIVHDTAEALTRQLIALDAQHYLGFESPNDILTVDDVPERPGYASAA